jgi:hypothetical protein
MIDLNVIRERKKLYGDNLPLVAEAWSNYLGMDISSQSVCKMMALLKSVRIKHAQDVVREKYEELSNEELNGINSSLEDSLMDKANYLWIANNYQDYKNI